MFRLVLYRIKGRGEGKDPSWTTRNDFQSLLLRRMTSKPCKIITLPLTCLRASAILSQRLVFIAEALRRSERRRESFVGLGGYSRRIRRLRSCTPFPPLLIHLFHWNNLQYTFLRLFYRRSLKQEILSFWFWLLRIFINRIILFKILDPMMYISLYFKTGFFPILFYFLLIFDLLHKLIVDFVSGKNSQESD